MNYYTMKTKTKTFKDNEWVSRNYNITYGLCSKCRNNLWYLISNKSHVQLMCSKCNYIMDIIYIAPNNDIIHSTISEGIHKLENRLHKYEQFLYKYPKKLKQN